MIPNWIRSLFGHEIAQVDDGRESKLRGMQNLQTLNELVISGKCTAAQLNDLEVGAETLTLNLKKRDADLLKGKGVV